MKLLAAIKSFSHFKEIKDKIDGVVIGNEKLSASYPVSFEIEEMKKILTYANENKKMCIINVMNLLNNKKMLMLEELISKLKEYMPYYMFSDAGVFTLLKRNNIIEYGIYDPQTLITNSMDMNIYLSEGIKACGLSHEIPVKDIKRMIDNKDGNVMLKPFGYHQMFHSARHLISTYLDYTKTDVTIDNNNSFLKEETRDERYHIVENESGTILYRPYVLNYIKSIDILKEIDFLYFDSIFIEEDVFNKVIDIFYKALNDKLSLSEAIIKLDELELLYEDGFMYEDTVYQKEKASR